MPPAAEGNEIYRRGAESAEFRKGRRLRHGYLLKPNPVGVNRASFQGRLDKVLGIYSAKLRVLLSFAVPLPALCLLKSLPFQAQLRRKETRFTAEARRALSLAKEGGCGMVIYLNPIPWA